MERTTESSLLILILAAILAGTSEGGRQMPGKDKVYAPHNFFGFWPFHFPWPGAGFSIIHKADAGEEDAQKPRVTMEWLPALKQAAV